VFFNFSCQNSTDENILVGKRNHILKVCPAQK
jgi:hypothetical protein